MLIILLLPVWLGFTSSVWGFDELNWRAELQESSAVKLVEQSKGTEGAVAFARFRFESSADFQQVQLVLDQPRSRVHDDFSANVKISSNQIGIQFGLRLVLPDQVDPRTGKPVVASLIGGVSKASESWQALTVAGTPDAVNDQVRKLRMEMSRSSVEASGAYFDGCILLAEVHRGTTFIDVANVAYGPVVPPAGAESLSAKTGPLVTGPSVEIQRGQVTSRGQQLFLKVVPDHGESEGYLNRIGVNGVWVSDLNAKQRMKSLVDQQFVILATPPHPEFDPADFSAPLQGLPPLDATHPLPSIWYLGTSVSADQMPHLMAWAREVRSADRTLRRPLMADVLSLEGVASRQLDLVGISQLSVGGQSSFGESRNRAYLRQNSAAQLTLPWEWVQTEPSSALTSWRRRLGLKPSVLEPEQITMQLMALLSSGSRGVGFWKTRSMEAESLQQQEISKAVELSLLYLDIIEPLLGKGRVEGHIDVRVGESEKSNSAYSIWQSIASRKSDTPARYSSAPSGPDAALINSPGVSLILAGMWDNASHFVPQELFASGATMTVAATETASAWRVTATGIQGLRRQPTAGGLLVNIEDFDQFAVILVTSDLRDRQIIERRILKNIERAGLLFVELSELKLARVAETCAQIDSSLAGADTTAGSMFVRARSLSAAAREALGRQDFSSAERYAQASMREVRKIQNRYWYRVVQSLPTPQASPHSVSFSTLPDYWEMALRIQDGTVSENYVPSGSFDNLRLLSDSTWSPVAPQAEVYNSSADIVTESPSENHILRIRAWRKGEGTSVHDKLSLLVRSPEVEVEKGGIYEITGRVKLGQAIPADQESPLLIFDSDLGPEFAVKPTLEPSWRTFRILREASETGSLKVWLGIHGAAEVFLDDVSVRQIAEAAKRELPAAIANPSPGSDLSPQNSSRVRGAGYSVPSFP